MLKFIGDGLLAVFAVGADGRSVEQVRHAALAAADAARAAVLGSFVGSAGLFEHTAPFGLALHLRQVLYGNIGSGNRLDFTCIGPAINFAARLERLAGKPGRMSPPRNRFPTAVAAMRGASILLRQLLT